MGANEFKKILKTFENRAKQMKINDPTIKGSPEYFMKEIFNITYYDSSIEENQLKNSMAHVKENLVLTKREIGEPPYSFFERNDAEGIERVRLIFSVFLSIRPKAGKELFTLQMKY